MGERLHRELNARLRDELLDGAIVDRLCETPVVIESWWRPDNQVRSHASLGYRAPVPAVVIPTPSMYMAESPRSASPAIPAVAPRPAMPEHLPRTTQRGPTNCVAA